MAAYIGLQKSCCKFKGNCHNSNWLVTVAGLSIVLNLVFQGPSLLYIEPMRL